MKHILLYLTGLVFGLGISISGMANPAKVLNFFDIAGSWDPSLAFVMGAALLVTAPGYWLIFRRDGPIFGNRFHLPTATQIDRRLVLGSFTFGIGWALAGFCPGAALPVMSTLNPSVLIFTAALILGMLLARWQIART